MYLFQFVQFGESRRKH